MCAVGVPLAVGWHPHLQLPRALRGKGKGEGKGRGEGKGKDTDKDQGTGKGTGNGNGKGTGEGKGNGKGKGKVHGKIQRTQRDDQALCDRCRVNWHIRQPYPESDNTGVPHL